MRSAAYRLSGDTADRICSLHLYGPYRALVGFPDTESVVVLIVKEHLRTNAAADVYDDLYEILGIAEPTAKRTKPPCCDEGGEPPVDPDLIERFLATANRLQRRR